MLGARHSFNATLLHECLAPDILGATLLHECLAPDILGKTLVGYECLAPDILSETLLPSKMNRVAPDTDRF